MERILELPAIPVRDVRDGGPLGPRDAARAQARVLRDDCLSFSRRRAALARSRRHGAALAARSHSPYLREIEAIASRSAFRASGSSTAPTNGAAPRMRARRACRGCCARSTGRSRARPAYRVARMAGPRATTTAHLAGLCRGADRDGAGTLLGRDQPGAAVAADPPSLAEALRRRRQCGRDLVAPAHPAGPVAAPGDGAHVRPSRRRGRCWNRRRSRGR